MQYRKIRPVCPNKIYRHVSRHSHIILLLWWELCRSNDKETEPQLLIKENNSLNDGLSLTNPLCTNIISRWVDALRPHGTAKKRGHDVPTMPGPYRCATSSCISDDYLIITATRTRAIIANHTHHSSHWGLLARTAVFKSRQTNQPLL
jgi:hypothetical protein